MKLPNTQLKTIAFAKEALKKIPYYVWYFNVLVLLLTLVWLYHFVGQYFLFLKSDFKFVEEHITTISPVQLNEGIFRKVYQGYQDKLDEKPYVPQDDRIPF